MLLLYTSISLAQPNLVLISLDTTRADALSCYGSPPVAFIDHAPGTPRTPVLDGLAARGLRFERFFAESPSTLASHATLFTGLDPHQTGVVRNGFTLRPDVPTLAERLKQAGYSTRAVIGAAALERGMGIERGFEIYDDSSPDLRGLMYQTSADQVVDRALAVVDNRPDQPLFLFAHFFDAHAPYEAPEPWASRFVPTGYTGRFLDPEAPVRDLVGKPPSPDQAAIDGRYLAEVSWLDSQIGRLLQGLQAKGVLDDALVVVIGDHGEALSDDAVYAWTHGNDVSNGVMRVPLLIEAHGSVSMGRGVVQRTASMHGLAPTLETLLGLEATFGDGFYPLVRPGPVDDTEGWPHRPTTIVRMEATRPRQQESKTLWNNLPLAHRILVGKEEHQTYPAEQAVFEAPLSPILAPLLDDWPAPPHRTVEMAPHTRRALQALGYLDE